MKRLTKKIKPIMATAITIATIFMTLSGCSTTEKQKVISENTAVTEAKKDSNLAEYDGRMITYSEFKDTLGLLELMQNVDTSADTYTDFFTSALNYYIACLMYEDKANELGISATGEQIESEYDQLIAELGTTDAEFLNDLETRGLTKNSILELLKKEFLYNQIVDTVILDGIEITDQEISSYYNDNISSFKNVTTREVYQLTYNTETEALDCISKLQSDTKIEDMIEKNKDNSGYVGTVAKGQLITEMDEPVFNTSTEGVINKPIFYDGVYTVVYVCNFKENYTYSLSETTESIKSYLQESKRVEAINKYFEELKSKHSITLYQLN